MSWSFWSGKSIISEVVSLIVSQNFELTNNFQFSIVVKNLNVYVKSVMQVFGCINQISIYDLTFSYIVWVFHIDTWNAIECIGATYLYRRANGKSKQPLKVEGLLKATNIEMSALAYFDG